MSSYRIQAKGTRADVIAAVKAATTDTPDASQVQIDAERTAILAEIAALPAKYTGLSVLAIGDDFPGQFASNRNIYGYVIDSPDFQKVKPVVEPDKTIKTT
jgi:hypothetical protein